MCVYIYIKLCIIITMLELYFILNKIRIHAWSYSNNCLLYNNTNNKIK